MINEKKKILKVNLQNNGSSNLNNLLTFSDNTSRLYFDILNQTSENLWWTCTSIILQYIYLIFFVINHNVSEIYKLIM